MSRSRSFELAFRFQITASVGAHRRSLPDQYASHGPRSSPKNNLSFVWYCSLRFRRLARRCCFCVFEWCSLIPPEESERSPTICLKNLWQTSHASVLTYCRNDSTFAMQRQTHDRWRMFTYKRHCHNTLLGQHFCRTSVFLRRDDEKESSYRVHDSTETPS